MKLKITLIASIFTLILMVFSIPGFASDAPEVYIVTSDDKGEIHYVGNMDVDVTASQTGVGESPSNLPWCGIGDFDNDGDFDFLAARQEGPFASIYMYTNIGAGPVFNQYPSEVASWATPPYEPVKIPKDTAVADFDKDGDLDLIVTFVDSESVTLFSNDLVERNNVRFVSEDLLTTVPRNCKGLDAADFNNDGFPDFITAGNESYPFELYIHLNNGDGTFPTKPDIVVLEPGHAVSGIAAADIDDDDNVDVVAVFENSVYVYPGNGDGSFDEGALIINDGNIGTSAPLDVYDLNGDGNLDIVVGNYLNSESNDRTAVAVYFGLQNGRFSQNPVVYTGGTGGDRVAISAPPYRKIKRPHAIVNPEYQEIIAGQMATFDASASYSENVSIDSAELSAVRSYNENSNIVSYEWDFGDNTVGGGASNPHVYYKAGLYTVTLTVTDVMGISGSSEVTVKVVPVPAAVKIFPYILNLNDRRGGWMHAIITLPDPYDVSRVDLNSVYLSWGDSSVKAVNGPVHGFHAQLRKFLTKHGILFVTFKKKEVSGIIEKPSPSTVLSIQGMVGYNDVMVEFEGSDTIRTFKPQSKKHKHKNYRKCINNNKCGRH